MFIQLEKPAAGAELATLQTTLGDITIQFFPQYAPKAVENFLTHAKEGYYDGLIFHRVIPDFMIQGGDPKGTGTGGESIWGKPFEDEFCEELRNFTGALSMANAGPNTNGSQFFIVYAPTIDRNLLAQMEAAQWPLELIAKYKEIGGTPWLDQHHTVFGHVVDGLDVVKAISQVKRDRRDRPVEEVRIEHIVCTTAE